MADTRVSKVHGHAVGSGVLERVSKVHGNVVGHGVLVRASKTVLLVVASTGPVTAPVSNDTTGLAAGISSRRIC